MPYWTTIKSIVDWYPVLKSANDVPTVSLPLAARRIQAEPGRRKLLVCHDMMGGFTPEDSCPHGNPDLNCVFTLHYWNRIDLFVYFSHHRVTVPPVQWTNLAHKNGCLSLGTILFEGHESLSDLDLLVYGEPAVNAYIPIDTVCLKLVEIAEYYKLDGWLLNVEVSLPGREGQANHLCRAVSLLRSEMTRRIPHSQVIWYDAVTRHGQLSWQNMLNDANKPFFQFTDGIFTNYNWGKEFPKESCRTSGEERRHDIYMGTDVFGRGTYGGGGWNSYKALKVTASADTSAALFAPAWIHECHGLNGPQKEKHDMSLLWELEKRLWQPMFKWLANPARPLVLLDCGRLSTYFCTAAGKFFSIDGVQVSDNSWSDHSLQSVFVDNAELCTTEAYFGGSCLKVRTKTFEIRVAKETEEVKGYVVVKGVPKINIQVFPLNNGWCAVPVRCDDDGVIRLDWRQDPSSPDEDAECQQPWLLGQLALAKQTAEQQSWEKGTMLREVWTNAGKFVKVTALEYYPVPPRCHLRQHDQWKLMREIYKHSAGT